MYVEPKRVKKVDSPLLIIGLGGTGSDALLTIMDKFKKRFVLEVTPSGETLDAPERTAYLAFDTDAVEMRSRKIGTTQFRQENIFKLNIPSKLGFGTIPSYITNWWDSRLTGYEIQNGAGGIRQVGRFVLFHNVDAIVSKLFTVIKNLIALPANQTMGTLEIVLTTGISGGTGSGTFLDMAYLIRYTMEHYFPSVTVNFMSYILMPNVNVDKIPGITEGKKNMLEATGFAALKELDFWMNYNTHHYPFSQRYSDNVVVEWNKKPFDNVILMSNAKKDGTIIKDAYNNCLDILSESVLNFYADEAVGTDGQISLRSHLSNISGAAQFLNKKYPANYTYMSVGAAVSGDQKDVMVTYEAKKTLERVMELKKTDKVYTEGSRHAAPLLKDRAGETFLQKFFPPELDYFGMFANQWMDPNFFTDPNYTPQVIHDGAPWHGDPYQEWIHNCDIYAKNFAVQEVRILEKRFREMVRDYVTDLKYGPYTTSEFLKDPEDGFVGFFTRLVKMWEGYEDSCLSERNNAQSEVTGILYPKMADMNKVAQLAGLWGPVTKYKDGCLRMFHAARDYALAKEIAAELKEMNTRVRGYCGTILPAFCSQLDEVNRGLDDTLKMMRNAPEGNRIASNEQITDFVDEAFGDPVKDGLAVKVLAEMVRESQSIQLNNMGTIEGMEECRAEFEHAMDRFVQNATASINGANMDDILNIVYPEGSEQEKVEYLSQTLLPSLKIAAQTMLPLTVGADEANEYIPYAYASIPIDAPIIQKGVAAYQQTERNITPKESEVTDRIYWLNTLNCVPLYMFVDLPRLEKVYEMSRVTIGAQGLHLVYAPNNGIHELYNDWSLLPSPVVHELQKIAMPKAVAERHQLIETMFEKALANGAIKMGQAGGLEQLTVVVREENGKAQTMEQFEEQLSEIQNNPNLDPEGKIREMKLLGEQGTSISIDYTDYSQVFADANGLRLQAAHNTRDEVHEAEENLKTAKIRAAEYILYSWKPQLAEEMIAQQEMHEKLKAAIEKEEAAGQSQAEVEGFVKNFMGLYLNDTFTFGRTGVSFKDVRGQDVQLFAKADLTDDELTIFADYCNALVLVQILADEKDPRINIHDRRYLKDQAAEFAKNLDRMPDAEYDKLVRQAREFRTTYAKTADAITYDRGSMPEPLRKKMADLMDKLLIGAKVYS